ncbi:hypothetical protein GGC64_006001 [Mycobacterium sp. OAS707]|uniref:hypothetical protein n=1 Tax=Mycobacterium sp. OAS707 TaxID=2663822 RepID=UPI00178AE451|nr:hypothetical protein [Mycobacterium sp. OAS707]MBE1551914.1 hypothetical protein [Mycobacterium sp. OAS707]
MTEELEPSPFEAAVSALSVGGVEILLASMGAPGLQEGAAAIERLVDKRRRKGTEHVAFIAGQVGSDELLNIIQTDDERSEILWSSTQTSMSSADLRKRVYLAQVVAVAMTSSEPIDEALLIVSALRELDRPHIRALVRIREADMANQKDPGLNDDVLQGALRAIPYPVLAALARTGVVRQGSEQRGNGLFSITYADTLGITGISEFGRTLLADLESVAEG